MHLTSFAHAQYSVGRVQTGVIRVVRLQVARRDMRMRNGNRTGLFKDNRGVYILKEPTTYHAATECSPAFPNLMYVELPHISQIYKLSLNVL